MIPLLVILATLLGFIVMRRRHMRRLRMVEAWLMARGFRVIHVGEARLYDDPQFIHLSTTGRLAYYVDVLGPADDYRRGVVLLGGTLLAPSETNIEVHWAEPVFDGPPAAGFPVIFKPSRPPKP